MSERRKIRVSLVRYLTYANQFETEGLVPTTSIWLPDRTCPSDMHKIVDGYAAAVSNLNAHTHPDYPYPPVSYVKSLVLCWGGINVLAQTPHQIRKQHDAVKSDSLRSKIRVYAISGQGDFSAWLRSEFPDAFYISSIHAWNQYGLATWAEISGEAHYGFDEGGPDGSKISKEWVKENIQIGPLERTYTDPEFVFEGDTPTFLGCPAFGSWGGRYGRTDPSKRVRHYGDAADRVVGADGRTYKSNQATVWRIRWSMIGEFEKVNHHPVVLVNEHEGLEPLWLEVEAGKSVRLDVLRWFQYEEPSVEVWSAHKFTAKLEIEEVLEPDGRVFVVRVPLADKCCVEFKTWKPVTRGQVLHILATYNRVLIQTVNSSVK
ncbi:uncharacterized protein BCR38DRAFT_457082 [Pseudomassariella vexata]|uniref:Cellulose-binding Sde182 nucleoside hydrolase-like domain-containing protein n=1 Tax=Pseudomassariella vexata TaxID=1141098 RepID=A0A1Y2E4U6_9PEZI|nr:uncharacterized protein BCR38DRAFT_457082 [Pseudomassariella vexata]ORY66580.1 hypothetical protein BCR38DRAFT_457082 [Pseudomassariella vexata]